MAAATALAYHYYAGWESTDDAQIDGYINPISSRVSGYVTNVYVDDNQYVKAGTLLARPLLPTPAARQCDPHR